MGLNMSMVFSDFVKSRMKLIEDNSSKIDNSNLKNFIMIILEDSFKCGQAVATFEAMLLRKRSTPLGIYASDDYWTSDSVIMSAKRELAEIEEKLMENIMRINTQINEIQRNLISESLRLCHQEGYRNPW
jgi:hypothetical protein